MTDHGESCNCKPVGQILDSMGLTVPLEDGEIITNAIVIFTVAHPEKTGEACILSSDPGLGFFKLKGMVTHTAESLAEEPVE